jgi:hypothetical protein
MAEKASRPLGDQDPLKILNYDNGGGNSFSLRSRFDG